MLGISLTRRRMPANTMLISSITTGPTAVAYSPVAITNDQHTTFGINVNAAGPDTSPDTSPIASSTSQSPLEAFSAVRQQSCDTLADFEDNSAIGIGIHALLGDVSSDTGDPDAIAVAERQLGNLTHTLAVLINKFPGMIRQLGHTNYRCFKIDVPLDDFRLNRVSTAKLLQEIVPWWPDSAANLQDAILQLAQDHPFDGNANTYQASEMSKITAHLLASDATPAEWPDAMMQTVLRIGDWQRINLRGADLQGHNFSGFNLRGADLSLCNLEHGKLCNSDLSGCDLTGANLRYADLKHCRLSYSTLADCDLFGANMHHADARGVTFDGADMSGVTATQADFNGSGFNAVQLQDANFEKAQLNYTNGLACSRGTSFCDASLSNARIAVQASPPDQPQTFWNLLCRRGPVLRELAAFRRGQFQALCSIDKERFVGCQTAALRDLVTLIQIDGHDSTPIAIEEWIRTTGSSSSSLIRGYVTNVLLPALLEDWNSSRVIEDAPLRRQVLRYVTENNIVIDWAPYGLAVNQLLGMRVAGALEGCDAGLAPPSLLADEPSFAV